jgi:hypothetical protein
MKAAIAAYKEKAASIENGQRIERHFVKGILEGFNIDRNKFYYELSKDQTKAGRDGVTIDNAESGNNGTATESSENSASTESSRNKVGRPPGSTNAATEKRAEKKEQAISWAAKRLKTLAKDPTKVGRTGSWKRGILKELVTEARKKFDVDERDEIKKDTIRKRYDRDRNRSQRGPESVLKDLEPIFVATCVAMQRILVPLKEETFLEFANSFIEGTKWETEVIEFKKKTGSYKSPPEGMKARANLGKKYYKCFMKRHKKILRSKKPRKFPKDRKDWATYENIEKMYDNVYQAMVDCGSARYLDEDEVTAVLENPEYTLFVDEVGINTNQKDGGNRGQERVIGLANSGAAPEECSTRDVRATVMCYTAATGEPVMCVIILQGGKKDLPFLTTQGFDWLSDYDGIQDVHMDTVDNSFFESNISPGGLFPGGPTCTFRGKQVPCYVTATPHGGIDGEVLTDTLRTMDNLELFERRDDLCPFVLLDGHQSRFEEGFLRYINDPAHRWVVAIGVPYGTHIWQVGDSSEQNGSFKMSFNKWLDKLYARKRELNVPANMVRSDIVPLV